MATKRKQLEAQGWKFTVVMKDYDGRQYPAAWIATPPAGHHASERRFESHSDWDAVKWAFEQAKAKPLDSGLSGIAAIADLMQKARTTGVVAEVDDPAPVSTRPDGELISLCREALGADRITDRARADWVPPAVIDLNGTRLGDSPAFKEYSRRINEASRLKRHALEALVELKATTLEGVLAKARVFGASTPARSGKMALAQSLAADVLAVLGDGVAQPRAAGGD